MNHFAHIKPGWWSDGTRRIYMRSGWEHKYADHLNLLIKAGEVLAWDYEPDTFWFDKIMRGVRSYKPDFRVQLKDGTVEYHEVKGYLDAKSKTKLKRMAKYYPDVKVVLLTGKRLREILRLN